MPTHNPYLLSGSFAYDTILRHPALFSSSILPDALHKLNVSFDIESVTQEFGGCGGNIAYNAALLKVLPLLVGCVGHDASSYLEWLESRRLDTSTLTRIHDVGCAHAWLVTDNAENQITPFSMGAMRHMPELPFDTPDLWHLAPENPVNTATLALRAITQGKSYFFDPGQALPGFLAGLGSEVLSLDSLLNNAMGIFVNDYEAELLVSRTGESLDNWLVNPGNFVLRTRGAQGVTIRVLRPNNKIETISCPVAQADKIVDPTGCGDALRAGFLAGYAKGWPLESCLTLGSVMGSFAIEASGGQNHSPSFDEIMLRHAVLNDELDCLANWYHNLGSRGQAGSRSSKSPA